MQFIEDGSAYPNEYTWEYRQEKFRRFEGAALGDHVQSSHPQKEALLREMEQTFCAGAWIATIFLAWSIIDIQLSYIGYSRKGATRANALSEYINFDALEELRIFRNAVLHRSPEQSPIIDEWEMIFDSEAIREKAILAVSLALRVAFICTKYPELDQVRKPSA